MVIPDILTNPSKVSIRTNFACATCIGAAPDPVDHLRCLFAESWAEDSRLRRVVPICDSQLALTTRCGNRKRLAQL